MEQLSLIILAVDDIEDNLLSLKAVIKESLPKAVVFTANSGRSAIEIARRTLPDVILLDIVMPGMDGYETCKNIKSDEELSIVPVVFLTALKTTAETRIKALEVGADGFLNKPLDEQLLIAQILAMKKLKDAQEYKRDEKDKLEAMVQERTKALRELNSDLLKSQLHTQQALEDLHAEMESRKRSDSAKILSQNLLQKVFDILPLGLWIADKDGTLLSANNAGRKIWGNEPHVGLDEYGMFKARRLPSREEILPEDWALAKTVKQGVTFVDEMLEIDAFDGKKRIILNYTAPVLDENKEIQAAIVVNQDISEKVRHEMIRALQANIARAVVSTDRLDELCALIREELSTLFDTTNFVFALYDEKQDMLYAPFETDEKGGVSNSWQASSSLTGYMLNMGKPLLLSKQDIENIYQDKAVKKIGHTAECWMGAPLSKRNKVSGALLVQSYDNPVAYDKNCLEVLEIVAHELSIYIEKQESVEELISAKEKAEESDRLKTYFLQNMSHEIRTPMNGILGFAELLEQDGLDPEEVKEYATYIRNSGNRMMELIKNILDVSKIESGVSEVSQNNIKPEKLMEESYREFINVCREKNLKLSFEIAPELQEQSFISDEMKLSQILSCLLSNAVKFSSQGSVEYSLQLQQEKLLIRVKDSGCGIAPKHWDRIFDRFYQADMSMTRGFEGAGLGLSICKGLVTSLQGEIGFSSEVGIGSIFEVLIPIKINRALDIPALPDTEILNSEDVWILVAEDDDLNFVFLQRILDKAKLKVIRAINGKEAITHALSRDDIALILMDIKMPVMSGLEATQKIKEQKPNLPIIAQTAYAFESEKAAALEAGCDAYLTKPIKTEDLLRLIGNIIKI